MKRNTVFSSLSFLVAIAFSVCSDLPAQVGPVPGRNVNMVSGTQLPGGDPYLQRQNEPSIAVSTRNPQALMGGANDYRTVDIPFPPDTTNGVEKETGDAWLGVFTSIDGGQTWLSTLLPGYPQDQSATGLNSPLHGFAAATDPTVRAGTHGLFYYSGLVFNRGNNAPSGVFVATFQNQNNKGNALCSPKNPICSGQNAWNGKYVPAFEDPGDTSQNGKPSGNPFLYLNATLVDSGTSGQFLDKPWIAVDVPRPGTAVGTASCVGPDGNSFVSGNAYVFYTNFNGSTTNPGSSIKVVISKNCGSTWSKPVKISQSSQENQGTVATVDPVTGTVYVFWRQIGNGTQNQPDSILYASSANGGATWTTGTAYTFPNGYTFDEGANNTTFRSEDLPAAAVDQTGRVWLAFSQRNVGPYGTSKIMVTTLTPGGKQKSWTNAFAADPDATSVAGHQIMPAFAFAYGRLMLTWLDTRDDNTTGQLIKCVSTSCTTPFSEVRNAVGDRAAGNLAKVFGPAISDSGMQIRHTIDVRGALVDPTLFNGSTLPFPSVRISQYKYGSRPGSKVIEQMQFNPPNFPMFSHGTKPFIGDYIDVAGLTMVVDPTGKWVFNTQPSNAAVFHTTWTDNRDVRPPPVILVNGVPTQDWAHYTPVGSNGGTTSAYDSSQTIPACDPARNGSRNQNVYTARITQGLLVGFKENSKNLTTGLTRAFSVFARNTTDQTAFYRLTINPPPAGTTASFSQSAPVSFVDVTILPRTTVSRTVFVNSSAKKPVVSVTVAQIGALGGSLVNGGLVSTTATNPDITNPDITNPDITNPDITNPDITNPDITNPDITNPDITNAEVYDPTVTNPDITNPDITNPDITNPDITNPDITNPDITNPDITNVQVTNPDITNPDITNPDITNPDITNPDITNPDITNPADGGGITDFTFKLRNGGNTSSSFSAKQFAKTVGVLCGGSVKCQLIARKTYPTPIASGCTLSVEVQNIPIASIPNPPVASGNVGTPDNGSDTQGQQPDATVSLGPGEAGRVTLRVFGLLTNSLPSQTVKTVAVAGGVDTGSNAPATSLTITTVELPVAVVGTPYSTTLTNVGGVAPFTWSIAANLPAGFALSSTSGTLSTGTVSDAALSASPYPLPVSLTDSKNVSTGLTSVDKQNLLLDVNKFSVSSITATTSNGNPLFVNGNDRVTVTITVSNQGPAMATNVSVPNFMVNAIATGTPSGSAPAFTSCNEAAPTNAVDGNGNAIVNISGNGTATFIYTCSGATGNGTITFSAGATGSYINTAATVNATAASVTTPSSLTVDTTPPTLTLVSVSSNNLPYKTGTWTNHPVTLVYTCTDNLSGLASQPVIAALQASSSVVLQTPDLLHATATVTLTAPPDFANGSVAAACQDQAGNAGAPPTVNPVAPIMIDTTSPTIPTASAFAGTPSTPYVAGTWTNQNVTVTFTCNDNLSGPSAVYPVITGLPTGVVPVITQVNSLTATASATLTAQTTGTTLTATCSDNAANSAAAVTFGPIMIDKTLPAIGITTPASGQTFILNSQITPAYACDDAGGGDLVISCIATPSGSPYIASSVGSNTFTVNAADQAGNIATASTNYTVIYGFTGFAAPLQPAGPPSSPSNSGSFALGSTISFQWVLQDANNALIGDTTSLKQVSAASNSACTGAADGAPITLYAPPIGSPAFAFDNATGTFTFTWDTTGVAAACYNVVVTLSDGTQHATIVNVVPPA